MATVWHVFSNRAGMTWRILCLVAGVWLVVLPGYQQSLASSTTYPITGIDKSGLVTVTDLRSKQTFQFQVPDPKLLSTLKVGQLVYPDFPNQKVSLDGRTLCCGMVNANQLRVPLERGKLPGIVQPGGLAPERLAPRPLSPSPQVPAAPGSVPTR